MLYYLFVLLRSGIRSCFFYAILSWLPYSPLPVIMWSHIHSKSHIISRIPALCRHNIGVEIDPISSVLLTQSHHLSTL